MKKKILATLFAGAVLTASVAGLTACGGGVSMPKGKEVTAEEWTQAFKDTLAAKNYTAAAATETKFEVTGKLGDTELNVSASETREGKNYVDLENNTTYAKVTSTIKIKGADDLSDEMKETLDLDVEEKTTVTEQYYTKIDDTIYYARYYKEEWEVETALTVFDSSMYYLSMESYATEESAIGRKSLSELYDSFTYEKGVYTATLYMWGYSECTISVAIKDGYVIGFEKVQSEEDKEGEVAFKSSEKTTYVFSNFGKTTVKASQEAIDKVNEYKNK